MTTEKQLSAYNDILIPKDVCDILKIGKNTLYKYLATGKLKSIKIAGMYRIPKDYLIEFIYSYKE